MTGAPKAKKSSEAHTAHTAQKKAAAAARASASAYSFVRNENTKIIIKLSTVLAAVVSLLLLLIVGADFRPSAVMQGFRDKYAFTHASGDGFPVNFTGSRIIRASSVRNGTAVLTNTKCIIYDGKGREVSSSSHLLSSPAMESAGGYVLMFDSMGRDYRLMTPSGEKCRGETENSIICAGISDAGKFALITNSEINNARLIVYSDEGGILHKWKSVNYKISDVALSKSGKYVAVCGLSSSDGVLVSTVILQKVGAKENLKEFKFENTLIVDIAFEGDSGIIAVGDEFATYLSVKNDSNKIYDYNGRTLNYYDFSDNGDLALVFSGNSDGRNSSVVVIGDNGKEKAQLETEMTAPYVDLENGRINLLYQSCVSSYNYKGELLKQSEVQADCQSVFTSEGRLLSRGVMYLSEVE